MKCVVVGCGSIGRRHLTNLLSLGVDEVIGCDASSQACAEVRQQFAVPVFTNVEDALAFGPDAVLVCTPTISHLTVAERALAAGAHVFIEKPLALDPEEVTQFIELASRTRQVVLCAANMRFHPGVARLKLAIVDGLVGEPWLVRAHFAHYLPNWRPGRDYRCSYSAHRDEGGGIVLECVHEIDYVLWLLGEEQSVGAFGSHVSTLQTDGEDTALLMFQFANGAVAEIHVDCLRPVKSRGCELVGSAGCVRWLSEGKSPEQVQVDWCPLTATEWQPLFRSAQYDTNEMYVQEMKHFLECARGQSAPIVDAVDARRALRVAAACRRAIATKIGAEVSAK